MGNLEEMLYAWSGIYLVETANFFTSFLAVGFLLGGRSLIVNAFNSNISPTSYRLIFSISLTPSLLNLLFPSNLFKNLTKLITISIIVVGIYLNVKFVYSHYEIYCQGAECILGPQTFLSKLYFPLIWRLFVL